VSSTSVGVAVRGATTLGMVTLRVGKLGATAPGAVLTLNPTTAAYGTVRHKNVRYKKTMYVPRVKTCVVAMGAWFDAE
jgi:hypothetical protein